MENRKHRVAYLTISGRKPVEDFVENKDEKGKAKIDFCFNLLMEKGPGLKRPYAAYLRDKIWELRPGINTEEYRLLYFWFDKTAVFVHAVDKKDFKQSDIDTAVKRMKMIVKGGI